MATAFSPANNTTVTTAATFIPKLWSDEIVAAYKKNLVLANVIKRFDSGLGDADRRRLRCRGN